MLSERYILCEIGVFLRAEGVEVKLYEQSKTSKKSQAFALPIITVTFFIRYLVLSVKIERFFNILPIIMLLT